MSDKEAQRDLAREIAKLLPINDDDVEWAQQVLLLVPYALRERRVKAGLVRPLSHSRNPLTDATDDEDCC